MSIIGILLVVTAVLLSLSFHEFAHGYAAWYKGDTTAKSDGRLSLNPLDHLDLWGSITFIVTFLVFKMPFGWAKPVPVNPMNLDNPKKDMVLVAFAGPLSNMILALISGYLFIWTAAFPLPLLLRTFLVIFVQVNLGLAFFNLLPIPPLDGSNIVRGLLPYDKLVSYIKFTSYLPQIFIGLLLFGMFTGRPILSYIFSPIVEPWFFLWEKIIFGGRIPF